MFSIVIPLYNKAHTIQETLASVFAQTCKQYEIIIVDDGSTDGGATLISNNSASHKISIIKQENAGVSAARNAGVLRAAYDYIAFLDGDDLWLPDYLHTVALAIHKYPDADLICTAGFIEDNRGLTPRRARKLNGKIALIEYFENPHVYSHISASTVRRETFFKAGGFPVGMKRNEDFVLLFRVALLGITAYCGKELSIYRGNIAGQSTTQDVDMQRNIEDIGRRMALCHATWQTTNAKTRTFTTFERYEIRHIVLGLVRHRQFDILEHFIHSMANAATIFNRLELAIWQCRHLVYLSMCLLYISKVTWRLKGYPVTGK